MLHSELFTEPFPSYKLKMDVYLAKYTLNVTLYLAIGLYFRQLRNTSKLSLKKLYNIRIQC